MDGRVGRKLPRTRLVGFIFFVRVFYPECIPYAPWDWKIYHENPKKPLASKHHPPDKIFGAPKHTKKTQPQEVFGCLGYLEDHPMTCKWLITILRTKPEKKCSFPTSTSYKVGPCGPLIVVNPTKKRPFL